MYKKLLVFIVLTLSVVAFQIRTEQKEEIAIEQIGAISWPYNVCGKADWDITGLTLDQTPKRNINDNIVVTGKANAAITFQRVDLDVKLNGVFLDKQTADYKESYDADDATEFIFANYIPSFAPPGTYNLTFVFKDLKGNDNGCLNFQFKL